MTARDELREMLYPKGFVGKYCLQPWMAWAIVARPYACRSCGRRYGPALDAEVGSNAASYMRELFDDKPTALGKRPHRSFILERFNEFMWCREAECSRFYAYDAAPRRSPLLPAVLGLPSEFTIPAMAPKLRMRKQWLSMPLSQNGDNYKRGVRC